MIAEKKTPGLGGDRAQNAGDIKSRSHYSIETALAEALASHGVIGLSVISNGEIHRFDAPDKKRGNLSGWYVCPTDDTAVYGYWHTGEQHFVTLKGEHDPIAAEQARQLAHDRRKAREAEKVRGYTLAARLTRSEWLTLPPADPSHGYLVAKHVKPHYLRQKGDLLVVPLTNGQRLINTQTIAPDGTKRFRPGGQVRGCYHPIGEMHINLPLLICEGWATAAALHEATGYAVAAAMNCGNLHSVALSLRARYPSMAIIVCADNDHRTPGNPGVATGKAAAAAVGGRCIWPPTLEGVSDYNDLAVKGGEVAL